MTNPYQSPSLDPIGPDQPGYSPVALSDHRWISQVRVFAILNAVQGVLEVPMGLFTTSMGVMFPLMFKSQPVPAAPGNPPATFYWTIAVVYFAIGIPVLICGILRIVAAWRNYQFRGRTLGMISIIAGIGSMLSCYCAPTAIGLVIYGLIVFLNPAVQAAFQMAQQGYTTDQILAVFNPYSSRPQAATPGDGQSPFGER